MPVTPRYLSPLRYPGGKARLARFVGELIAAQPLAASRYVEPFAGGAGVGLRLLFDEYVDEIVLNDLNPGIAAFWRAVFFQTDALAERIRGCRPTVDEWHRQRAFYDTDSKQADDVQLGFATFFLNRTNRSGILDARPIGGLDQSGAWGIDARFDNDKLEERVRRLSAYASRVLVCEDDGIGLIEDQIDDPESFIYADPPYLVEGDDLYLDTLDWDDHKRLAEILVSRDTGWFLTYDADSRITDDLYAGLRCAEFSTAHTAAVQHIGSEYAVFPSRLHVPSLGSLGRRAARFVVA